MKILAIGGSGFIGTNFYKLFKETRDITIYDALDYPSTQKNGLWDLGEGKNIRADARDVPRLMSALKELQPDVIINFAAVSHVDRSINGDDVMSHNTMLVHGLLQAIQLCGIPIRLVQFSTDEVYGDTDPTNPHEFNESEALKPSSPYSASKAAADMLCHAYHRTYGIDVVTVRPTNNYGPYQYPEKLIPFLIKRKAEGKPLPLYGDGLQKREWLYVEDCVRAVELVMREGLSGEIYNIGSGTRVTNKHIAEIIGGQIVHIEDRPGHDLCYAVDSSKIRGLGWEPATDLHTGLENTLSWYRERLAILQDMVANPHIG